MPSEFSPKHPSTLAPLEVSQRNISVILPSFTPYLSAPSTSKVLELASGSGVHVAELASAFPDVEFQPTECDEYGLKEIDTMAKGLKRVKRAKLLDLLDDEGWGKLEEDGPYDVVVGANFLHMIPFPEGSDAVFKHLSSPKLVDQRHGRFLVYGPFKSSEGFFSESDKEFDATIKSRPNGEYLGLREIEALEEIAMKYGWTLREKMLMPKGNFTLVWGTLALDPKTKK